MSTVLVVGASLGGLRAAEQIRALGNDCRVIVAGDEQWMPYNRPPLTKDALLDTGHEVDPASLAARLAFRPRAAAADVEWRLGSRAVSSDLSRRTVTFADGSQVEYDALVVATGLRPRHLPQVAPTRGRHALRTVDDVAALRRELRPGATVVVVGGGFIGCEAAATLDALGCNVTVVEPLQVPMMRALGIELGSAILRHHRECGVRFVTGLGVETLVGSDDRVEGAVLDDGNYLEADVVVEAVGTHANVEWLGGNGLDLSDGVLCDDHLRVEGMPDVVAVGDVARFPNRRFDDVPRRVEHWAMPGETAKRAAATVTAWLGDASAPVDSPWAPLPSFWSDQFGLHLQTFGAPGLADVTDIVEGHPDRLESGLVAEHRRRGVPVGITLVNIPASRHSDFRSLLLHPNQLV